jgi:hypothetical protein
MSWSFRKDCVGFARSVLEPSRDSKGKSKKCASGGVAQGGGLNHSDDCDGVSECGSDEETLPELLCVLKGYFVSTVSHDVDEWLTWGK